MKVLMIEEGVPKKVSLRSIRGWLKLEALCHKAEDYHVSKGETGSYSVTLYFLESTAILWPLKEVQVTELGLPIPQD